MHGDIQSLDICIRKQDQHNSEEHHFYLQCDQKVMQYIYTWWYKTFTFRDQVELFI